VATHTKVVFVLVLIVVTAVAVAQGVIADRHLQHGRFALALSRAQAPKHAENYSISRGSAMASLPGALMDLARLYGDPCGPRMCHKKASAVSATTTGSAEASATRTGSWSKVANSIWSGDKSWTVARIIFEAVRRHRRRGAVGHSESCAGQATVQAFPFTPHWFNASRSTAAGSRRSNARHGSPCNDLPVFPVLRFTALACLLLQVQTTADHARMPVPLVCWLAVCAASSLRPSAAPAPSMPLASMTS